jgi:hypothetical protein
MKPPISLMIMCVLLSAFSALAAQADVAKDFSKPLEAEIVPAPLFRDGAVLQRDKPVPVWGRTEAGGKVIITFAGQTKTATADARGRWQVKLDPMPATASKNGNLLLHIPLKHDGTIDPEEEKVLADLGAWMAGNGEAIYGTRPWLVFGEGRPQDGGRSKPP